jgi:serine/threonine protein kinase
MGKNKNYKDIWYQYIVENKLDKFLEISGINKKIHDLFFKMVTNDVDKRILIDDVIDDPWFDEINKLSDEEKKQLDEEIKKNEFEERKELIEKGFRSNNADIYLNNNFGQKYNLIPQNKSIEEKNKPFEKAFSLDGLEELEEDDLNMKYYFKINDFNNYLNIHNFMNNLVCELEINDFEKEKEKTEKKIIPNKNEYQIDIIFKNKEQTITEELKELGFNDYNEYLEAFHMQDLIIGIKLYREFNGYLINVYKKAGINNFNEYLEKIMKIIKNLF